MGKVLVNSQKKCGLTYFWETDIANFLIELSYFLIR